MVRLGVALGAVLVLAGCARQGYSGSSYGAVPYDGTDPAAEARAGRFAPRRFYPPPGPAQDPWGPYIREAASRFSVPEQWIRAVMRQESGGREQAVSSAGAVGLMQVIPPTYETLRSRYRLGSDAFDPHNNVLAGTAYIREMYDRYGAPGFLAAYNAGPDRLDRYLAGTAALPDETVNYLAAITPNLGSALPLSGPLSQYAQGGAPAAPAPTVASLASGCDVNAAFDPDRPCAPLEQAATTPAPVLLPAAVRQAALQPAAGGGCDADAAYDPDQPCRPAPVRQAGPATTLYQPPARTDTGTGAGSSRSWAIQVGAFSNPGLARAVAEGARSEAPNQLRNATINLPTTTPFGGAALYRARLVNLSAGAAAAACQQLNLRQLPCVVVQPSGV